LEILDLATHTSVYIRFSYSIIAAASLYIRLQNKELVLVATGYEYDTLRPCIRSMYGLIKVPYAISFPLPTDKFTSEEFDAVIQRNSHILRQLLVMPAHQGGARS
jgi:hypothetical protein